LELLEPLFGLTVPGEQGIIFACPGSGPQYEPGLHTMQEALLLEPVRLLKVPAEQLT